MRHEEAIGLVWQMARFYRDGKKLAAATDEVKSVMDKALVVIADLILEIKDAEKDNKVKAALAVDVMREACPNLYPYIEVSTANISEKTAAWLNGIVTAGEEGLKAPSDPILVGTEFGWFINVSAEPDAFIEATWPKDLCEVVQFARARKCVWINMDQDADIVTELPKYDW